MVTLQNESTYPYPTFTRVSGSSSQWLVRAVMMKFGNREKRTAIIALHMCGSHPKEILVAEWFVFRTLVRYRETADVENRLWEACLHCVQWQNVVRTVCEHMRYNPLHHQKQLATKMGVSARSMSCILYTDFPLSKYRLCLSHLLTLRLKGMRLTWCAALLKHLYGKKHCNILFTDEKILTTEKKQNNKVYTQNCHSVMVWWGNFLSSGCRFSLLWSWCKNKFQRIPNHIGRGCWTPKRYLIHQDLVLSTRFHSGAQSQANRTVDDRACSWFHLHRRLLAHIHMQLWVVWRRVLWRLHEKFCFILSVKLSLLGARDLKLV